MQGQYLAAAAAAALCVLCLRPAAAEPTAGAGAAGAESADAATHPGGRAHPGPRKIQLAAVRRGQAPVPARLTRDVPGILAGEARAARRKRVFFKTVLPAVLRANAQIRRDRGFLAHVAARRATGAGLDPAARRRLAHLARRYETKPGNLATLRRRVDVVPPSLALAQAAIESGWGSSRFAQKANALFGQRAYDCGSCGLTPKGYDSDPGFRVRGFPTVMASVQAYMHNLNTHRAYRNFRVRRHAARREGRPLDAPALAGGLTRYSERRGAYVRDVRRTIRANDLTDFDSARLAQGPRLSSYRR